MLPKKFTRFFFKFKCETKVLIIFFMAIFFSCANNQEESYREYRIVAKGGERFGSSANVERKLLKEIQIDYFLSEKINWQKPDNWDVGEKGDFRLASFLTKDFLQITLVHFPNQAGGIRANVNRWAGQINLNLDPKKLADFIETLSISYNAQELPYLYINLLELVNLEREENLANIVVGIFLFKDEILFVKLMGQNQIVQKEKKRFINFINSITLDS